MCVVEDIHHLNEHTAHACEVFHFITCCILIGGLCCFGVLGNLTAFTVLWKHKNETITVFLLQCLALCDTVLLISTLLVYTVPAMYAYYNALDLIDHACQYITQYVWPISMIAHTATIWMTVLVTYQRFCCICKIGAHTCFANEAKVKVLVAFIFIFSVVYNIPRFYEHQPVHVDELPVNATDLHENDAEKDNGITESIDDNSTTSSPGHTILGDNSFYQIFYSNILYFLVMYIIPIGVTIYMNWRLLRAVAEMKRRKAILTGHKARSDHITQCIVVLVTIFILSQTPALINQIFWAATEHADRECGKFHFYFTKISDTLVVFNSSSNFVVYCLFGKTFREHFLKACCFRKTLSNVGAMSRKDECEGQRIPMMERQQV